MLHPIGVKIQLGLKPLRCNLTYSVYSDLNLHLFKSSETEQLNRRQNRFFVEP